MLILFKQVEPSNRVRKFLEDLNGKEFGGVWLLTNGASASLFMTGLRQQLESTDEGVAVFSIVGLDEPLLSIHDWNELRDWCQEARE